MTAQHDRTDDASWARQVRQVVSGLAPEHRTVLRLVYFEQMSQREAAVRVDLSERAFAAQLSAAMRGFTSALMTTRQAAHRRRDGRSAGRQTPTPDRHAEQPHEPAHRPSAEDGTVVVGTA